MMLFNKHMNSLLSVSKLIISIILHFNLKLLVII